MLSRRDKLLVQPWEDRRFRDHRSKSEAQIRYMRSRSKVAAAVAAVDARAPAARPHVALKLKKWQHELERARAVQRDNHRLLQRLAAVVRARRLDDRWTTPLPTSRHKVGLFYDAAALDARLAARALLPPPAASTNVRCYACQLKKEQYETNVVKPADGLYIYRGTNGPNVNFFVT